MSFVGDLVLYLVLFSAVLGALAYLRDQDSPLGQEFIQGLYSIGPIFVPVAGIMASIPYLTVFVNQVFGALFSGLGADPAMAATSMIAVDMGGYQLAGALAKSPESWMMAMVTGYMAGATIVFSIPVGLAMLDKKDHHYVAMGMMSGLLSIPIGVLVTSLMLYIFEPAIRLNLNQPGDQVHVLSFTILQILFNLIPLLIFVSGLAVGLWFFPKIMIRAFMGFGRFMEIATKLVLVASIIEHFTGLFTRQLGVWGFDPIIADSQNPFRALEVAGNISLMLAGAFPMVHLIKEYLSRPVAAVGRYLDLDEIGSAGLVATVANILAMYHLIPQMRPRDKVINIAFAVCAAFLLGDHLAFTVNFQPSLLLPVMMGKLTGGLVGILLARRFFDGAFDEKPERGAINETKDHMGRCFHGCQVWRKPLCGHISRGRFD